jgi:hypothetical protein
MKVLLLMLSVMMLGTVHEASASQKTTACLNSCTAQLATCSDVCVGQFGMGAKSCRKAILKRCKKLGVDAACPPEVTTTTTVRGSPTTSTTLATSNCSGTWCDQGDGTILDTATGLQWEKKTTQVGSGVNPADLHDVDNTYAWSGTCNPNSYCQPTQATTDTCNANTLPQDQSYGCQQCAASETCTVGTGAITTVWDWLNQLNASNFAGHNDWRLPSEAGCNSSTCNLADSPDDPHGPSCATCGPHELETILALTKDHLCLNEACIDPIFGPTVANVQYWTGTSQTTANNAWTVIFHSAGDTNPQGKNYPRYVRAVRTAQ